MAPCHQSEQGDPPSKSLLKSIEIWMKKTKTNKKTSKLKQSFHKFFNNFKNFVAAIQSV